MAFFVVVVSLFLFYYFFYSVRVIIGRILSVFILLASVPRSFCTHGRKSHVCLTASAGGPYFTVKKSC